MKNYRARIKAKRLDVIDPIEKYMQDEYKKGNLKTEFFKWEDIEKEGYDEYGFPMICFKDAKNWSPIKKIEDYEKGGMIIVYKKIER